MLEAGLDTGRYGSGNHGLISLARGGAAPGDQPIPLLQACKALVVKGSSSHALKLRMLEKLTKQAYNILARQDRCGHEIADYPVLHAADGTPREYDPATVATAHDGEDGVENPPQRVSAVSASCWQGWEMALDASPLGIREIAWIRRRAHGEQRTPSCHICALQNALLYYSAT
jgi:hypothetical protein